MLDFVKDAEHSQNFHAYTQKGGTRVDCNMSKVQESILTKATSHMANPQFLEQSLIPLITQELGVSLRVLDWLVTNYSKKTNLMINGYHVHNGYKDTLGVFRRKHFDPFRRNIGGGNCGRITFKHNDINYESTIGQINFIIWAHDHGVLEYVKRNINEIETDMNEVAKVRKSSRVCGTKRKALTMAPNTKCRITTSA